MQQEVDVLDVVVCLVGAMHLFLRLARVNALQNAKPPVRQGAKPQYSKAPGNERDQEGKDEDGWVGKGEGEGVQDGCT